MRFYWTTFAANQMQPCAISQDVINLGDTFLMTMKNEEAEYIFFDSQAPEDVVRVVKKYLKDLYPDYTEKYAEELVWSFTWFLFRHQAVKDRNAFVTMAVRHDAVSKKVEMVLVGKDV